MRFFQFQPPGCKLWKYYRCIFSEIFHEIFLRLVCSSGKIWKPELWLWTIWACLKSRFLLSKLKVHQPSQNCLKNNWLDNISWNRTFALQPQLEKKRRPLRNSSYFCLHDAQGSYPQFRRPLRLCQAPVGGLRSKGGCVRIRLSRYLILPLLHSRIWAQVPKCWKEFC